MNDEPGLATDPDDQEEDRFAAHRGSKPWLELLKESEKYFRIYHEKCDNIDKQYADIERLSKASGEREMQIFWANLEVLKPSIYSRPPVPVVSAKFKDRKPLVRHASEVLERSLSTSFELSDIHASLRLVRDDLATNARGVVWLRYENNGESEKVAYDHLERKDFRHAPSRKWSETGFVAARSYLSRPKMRQRFEKTSGDAWTKANYKERKEESEEYGGEVKAEVWELWSKDENLVVWVSEGVEGVLDISEPHLSLEGFFPCPRPAYGTLQRGTMKPVPDFLFYKDQIEEINEMTARISALAEGLRMKGFYAGGAEDISDAIEAALKKQDNNAILIPVSNFAALGGQSLKDAIVWLPLDQVATTIVQLIALRKQLIEDVYEISGLSDIMRGQTEASETLGAQQLKSQYGATRIRDRQEELVRIARDCTRIAGEIIAENFAPETMLAMSQYDEAPTQANVAQQIRQIQMQIQQALQNPELMQQAQANPQQAQQIKQQAESQIQKLQSTVTIEQVFEFLQNERMRPFMLEVETDSTIQPDEDAQKKRATEFLAALGTALTQLAPMVQARPETAGFAGEILKFAVAPFRAGRTLEASIEEFTDQMKQSVNQNKPDPAAEKLKMDAQAKQAEMKMKMDGMKADFQLKQAEMQLKSEELRIKMADVEGKMQAANAKAATDAENAALENDKTQVEIDKLFAEIDKIKVETVAKAAEPMEQQHGQETSG